MNKIFKTTYCIAMLLLMVLSSCLKENLGDYDPNGVNDLTINGDLKNAYKVNIDDVLKLNASVGQSQGNGSLTYQWYYYSVEVNSAARTVVSNTAQLELKIDMPTGAYMLVVETTDTKTGVKAYKKIALSVKRLTSEGWLLLTWKDNKANLSIVSSENEVLKNFLIPSDQFPINSKPEKLFCLNYPGSTIQPIVIQTAQPKFYFLDRNTFNVHSDETDAFSGISPTITHFGSDMYFNAYFMWDADGQVYQSRGGVDANYPSGFDQRMLGDYKAAKFVLNVSNGYPVPAVFYDEQSKRFLYQAYGGNTLLPFQAKPVNAPFSMSDFTDEIKFTTLGATSLTYIVGKNAVGEHHLYTMSLNTALDVYPAVSKVKLDIPVGVTPSFYAVSGKLPLLYYVVGNSIYLYKMGEKKTNADPIYTFPPGETIAAFQMFRETLLLSEVKNPLVNNRLVVAVNKGTEGIFYTFDLSPTGVSKTGKYTTKNEGFDTIVDIAYKENPNKK